MPSAGLGFGASFSLQSHPIFDRGLPPHSAGLDIITLFAAQLILFPPPPSRISGLALCSRGKHGTITLSLKLFSLSRRLQSHTAVRMRREEPSVTVFSI